MTDEDIVNEDIVNDATSSRLRPPGQGVVLTVGGVNRSWFLALFMEVASAPDREVLDLVSRTQRDLLVYGAPTIPVKRYEQEREPVTRGPRAGLMASRRGAGGTTRRPMRGLRP